MLSPGEGEAWEAEWIQGALGTSGLVMHSSLSLQRPDLVMSEQLGSFASDASCGPSALAVPVSSISCLLSDWPWKTQSDGCWALAVQDVKLPRPGPGLPLPRACQLLIGRSQDHRSTIGGFWAQDKERRGPLITGGFFNLVLPSCQPSC